MGTNFARMVSNISECGTTRGQVHCSGVVRSKAMRFAWLPLERCTETDPVSKSTTSKQNIGLAWQVIMETGWLFGLLACSHCTAVSLIKDVAKTHECGLSW